MGSPPTDFVCVTKSVLAHRWMIYGGLDMTSLWSSCQKVPLLDHGFVGFLFVATCSVLGIDRISGEDGGVVHLLFPSK